MRPIVSCRRTVAGVLVGLAVLCFASPGVLGQEAALRTEPLEVTSRAGAHPFIVEVAETGGQRARGLMFREEMPLDRGMLFIFDGEGERYFWMKNTPLPLDILYIDSSGAIVSIARDTTPFSEKVIPSNGAAQYVLELNAGTAERLEIAVGDRVTSPSMGAE